MTYGILLLRLVVGGTMAAHGAQKAFGAFGGPGPAGTRGMTQAMRFRAPALMALALIAAELGGGLLLALGLLTPLGALAIATVMVTAIATVHWPNGFFNGAGGYEFNLVLWASAVAIATTGPGRLSLDRLLGWDGSIGGLWWGVGVALASLAVGGVNVTVARAAEEPVAPTLSAVADERRHGDGRAA
jgi:putative oxidoreductase